MRCANQLPLKQFAEVTEKFFLHFFHVRFSSEFFLHRGHAFIINAAGNDETEVVKIRVHVEGEAVHGYPAAAAHADGADLSHAMVIAVPATPLFHLLICLLQCRIHAR